MPETLEESQSRTASEDYNQKGDEVLQLLLLGSSLLAAILT